MRLTQLKNEHPFLQFISHIHGSAGEGLSKIPHSVERIETEISFPWNYDQKWNDKNRPKKRHCRVCICFGKKKRKRRHINFNKIIDPIRNNRQHSSLWSSPPFASRLKSFFTINPRVNEICGNSTSVWEKSCFNLVNGLKQLFRWSRHCLCSRIFHETNYFILFYIWRSCAFFSDFSGWEQRHLQLWWWCHCQRVHKL